ncbi:X-Pro dipeptidyl-peptidase-like protein [Nocardia tenerifensis]|uniref:X-Pro dipeptidyl-peptidase-like protein n=1 Tax=Nocardia tenerifensis TaxID=228006 RepID=A0A318KBN3_9NOCA|nr:alpha/beta fold hydrolase [Nocardia tenerifensis]PXX68630.1 X-Pro dipeptidyl-peptidase-like protein [Nocardia tenerifensis]
MPESSSNQTSFLTEEQENQALEVGHALLTGDVGTTPSVLAGDIAEVRNNCTLGAARIPVTTKDDHGRDVELDAFAAAPLLGRTHPVVILPAGLTKIGWKMYYGAIVRLLLRGYAIVAYSERGLGDSTGQLTVAGPEDITDAREVIDWTLGQDNLRADPGNIGMLGLSYGSGISQLTALADPRVKAVVALSTWADLGEALYDNSTRHMKAARELAEVSTEPSAGLTKVLENFEKNENIDEVLTWARDRSPAHKPAVEGHYAPTFFTTYWHETIFPANQLLDYIDRYPGPKRVDSAVGDHGAVDVLGTATGIPQRTPDAGYAWFDRHLRGIDNGIDRDGILHTETMHTFAISTAPDVATWSKTPQRLFLVAPTDEEADGLLEPTQPTSYLQSFQAGTQQVQMTSALIFGGWRERFGFPDHQSLAAVKRREAAVWKIPSLFTEAQHIAGIPTMRLTVTPPDKTITLITYLFDHNPAADTLTLITHAATTLDTLEPAPTDITFRLQAADYHVPADHQLVLITDTRDPLYDDGHTITTGAVELSDVKGPAYLDIPMIPSPRAFAS